MEAYFTANMDCAEMLRRAMAPLSKIRVRIEDGEVE